MKGVCCEKVWVPEIPHRGPAPGRLVAERGCPLPPENAFGRAQRVGWVPLSAENSALAPSPLSRPFRSASDTPYSRTCTRHCQVLAPLPLLWLLSISFTSYSLSVSVFALWYTVLVLVLLYDFGSFSTRNNNSSTIVYLQKKLASWKEIDKTVAGVIHEAQVQRQLFFLPFFFFFFFCLAYTDRLGRIK